MGKNLMEFYLKVITTKCIHKQVHAPSAEAVREGIDEQLLIFDDGVFGMNAAELLFMELSDSTELVIEDPRIMSEQVAVARLNS